MATDYSLTSRNRQRLLRRLEADLAQMQRCQEGNHQMEATRSPGVVVCIVCRTVGVCLWCGCTLPAGACIIVCPPHRALADWQAAHRQGEWRDPDERL
ncbi:MAG TPA: hypothetical protein VGS80_03375 [Ktedonobacterales bacterium]|nr:hypothetical protein [Ktedonobacterales bacterium]